MLTVVEPTASIDAFLHLARPAFVRAGLLTVGIAALLSLALSYLLTRPIDRLARYADGIRLGKRPPFPKLGRTEIADLGLALRRMQEALEGRQYAEEYVQTLTHELKSPLSAIRGAAELLQEGMPRAAAGPVHRQHPHRGGADRAHRGPHAGAGASWRTAARRRRWSRWSWTPWCAPSPRATSRCWPPRI